MKNITKKIRNIILVLSVTIMGLPAMAYADEDVAKMNDVVNPVVELINSFRKPLLALVGAGGALFCIFLGVKFARADDPQEHEKAKKALKNAIIGFVLIFILILALNLAMPKLTDWVDTNQITSITPTATPKK